MTDILYMSSSLLDPLVGSYTKFYLYRDGPVISDSIYVVPYSDAGEMYSYAVFVGYPLGSGFLSGITLGQFVEASPEGDATTIQYFHTDKKSKYATYSPNIKSFAVTTTYNAPVIYLPKDIGSFFFLMAKVSKNMNAYLGSTITSVSPNFSPQTGIVSVDIVGTNLGIGSGANSDITHVYFGSYEADPAEWTNISPTGITVKRPIPTEIGDDRIVPVTVVSTSHGVARGQDFAYNAAGQAITNVDPSTGPKAGNTEVTITGTLLGSGTDIEHVFLNGVEAAIQTGQTATQVVVKSGATNKIGPGIVYVVSASRGSTGGLLFTYTTT